MREYVLRVRETGDKFTATLRPVEPHSTIDATFCGNAVHATAANEFAAMIGAITNHRIPRVPAAVLQDRETTTDPGETVRAPQKPLSVPTGPHPWDDPIRELFVLWPAWQEIVEYVSQRHPAEACPQSIYGAACAVPRDRLTARLYSASVGDTLDEAEGILCDLLRAARDGHRPRTGRELGLTREMFEERSTE